MNTRVESIQPVTTQDSGVFRVTIYAVQFFFGGWFLYNGLNFFITFFPQPSGSSGLSHELIKALIDTKLFAVVKGLEMATGLAFLANRFVPLAVVAAFPISFSIAHLNLIANNDTFSHVISFIVIGLNAVIALGYLDRFIPMLAYCTGDPSLSRIRGALRSGNSPTC